MKLIETFLTVKAIMAAKYSYHVGQPNIGNAQCGKTTESNSAKGQCLFLHPATQYMHTHACSVCIQGYKSKFLQYIIIPLGARCFSYSNTRNYGEMYLPPRVKRRCLRKQNFCHRSHVQVRRQF